MELIGYQDTDAELLRQSLKWITKSFTWRAYPPQP